MCTGDEKIAFGGADAVIMLGAFPRKVSHFSLAHLSTPHSKPSCQRHNHLQITPTSSSPSCRASSDSLRAQDGMERKDLLEKNCGIFKQQGDLLNTVASKNVKVLVVGNPANTNCLIASECAPNIPKSEHPLPRPASRVDWCMLTCA